MNEHYVRQFNASACVYLMFYNYFTESMYLGKQLDLMHLILVKLDKNTRKCFEWKETSSSTNLVIVDCNLRSRYVLHKILNFYKFSTEFTESQTKKFILIEHIINP